MRALTTCGDGCAPTASKSSAEKVLDLSIFISVIKAFELQQALVTLIPLTVFLTVALSLTDNVYMGKK